MINQWNPGSFCRRITIDFGYDLICFHFVDNQTKYAVTNTQPYRGIDTLSLKSIGLASQLVVWASFSSGEPNSKKFFIFDFYLLSSNQQNPEDYLCHHTTLPHLRQVPTAVL